MNGKEMSDEETRGACPRSEDLVTYLYGEAGAAGAQNFERHVRGCASCRGELNAFASVRTSVKEWRQESLGFDFIQAHPVNNTPAHEAIVEGREMSRSARAALREFFTLSPVWMRAATAAAAVAVCALLTIASANTEFRWDGGRLSLRTSLLPERVVEVTKVVEVERPAPAPISDAELRAKIEARALELAESRSKNDGRFVTTQGPVSPKFIRRKSPPDVARNTPSEGRPPQVPPRPIQRNERRLAPDGDEDLPRLSDLLGDTR